MIESLRLERSARIWSGAEHNAFTSLARCDGQWICAFREGSDHVSHDGAIRVIGSADGETWRGDARLTSPDPARPDLRDASLLPLAGGGVAVIAAATQRGDTAWAYQSYGWTTRDMRSWTAARPVADDGMWLWSLARDGDTVYGAGYWGHHGPRDGGGTELYAGRDPLSLKPVGPMRRDDQYPNEVAIDAHDGEVRALVRRKYAPDGTGSGVGTALFGVARAPHTSWEWRDTGIFIGGPALVTLPDGTLIAGGRKLHPQAHTALWRVDTSTGSPHELITLPSANDNGYPGLVWHDDRLWVSYYSTHEGRTSIYLAVLAAS